MAYLKILSGERKGERIEIDRDKIIIGRASDNVVHIDDPSVSGHHCCILREGRKFTLQDMDSTNGTLLNKVRVKEYRLSPQDIIQTGAIELLFDGKDVDPVDPIPHHEEATQLTTKLGPVQPHSTGGAANASFGVKKDRSTGVVAAIGVTVVVVVVLLVLFLLRALGE